VRHAQNIIDAAKRAGTVQTVVASTSIRAWDREFRGSFEAPGDKFSFFWWMFSLKAAMWMCSCGCQQTRD
jgi:hypothetical protein